MNAEQYARFAHGGELPDYATSVMCKFYAITLIEARKVAVAQFPHTHTMETHLRDIADYTYMTLPDARPWLDAIKKVMEIDTDTTDLDLILMRASVA
jgi:hypothetical protein